MSADPFSTAPRLVQTRFASPIPGRSEACAIDWERLASKAGLAFTYSVLLVLIEPFGLGENALMDRFGFWTAMIGSWFVLFSLTDLAVRAVSPRLARSRAGHLIPIAVSLVPIMILSTWVAEGVLGWNTVSGFASRALQVLVITLSFELVSHLLLARSVAAWRPAATDPAAGLIPPLDPVKAVPPTACRPSSNRTGETSGDPLLTSRLAQRLPFATRGEILCLQMEDHYVRVHTVRGSSLLLMRFSDALHELDGVEGVRTHRSWWVASAALDRLDRSARTVRLRLINGIVAPVSQPYRAAVIDLASRSTASSQTSGIASTQAAAVAVARHGPLPTGRLDSSLDAAAAG